VIRRLSLESPLSWPVRLGRLAGSWALIAVAVPMLLHSDLGVAPMDVLNSGLAASLPGSFALWWTLTGLLCYALGAVLGKPPGPASIAGTLLIGPLIDLGLRWMPEPDRLVPRIALLVGGILAIAVAICLVVSTELGAGPPEVVMLGLVHRGLGVVPARWFADGVPFVVGLALGGEVGIGTVLFVAAMGPMVKFGLRRLHYVPSTANRAPLALATE
jgi:uncharacterized membrane protein YczE